MRDIQKASRHCVLLRIEAVLLQQDSLECARSWKISPLRYLLHQFLSLVKLYGGELTRGWLEAYGVKPCVTKNAGPNVVFFCLRAWNQMFTCRSLKAVISWRLLWRHSQYLTFAKNLGCYKNSSVALFSFFPEILKLDKFSAKHFYCEELAERSEATST